MDAREIIFDNGNHAKVVTPPKGTGPKEIVDALNVPKPQSVIIIIGGAGRVDQLDNLNKSRLLQLFSRGIARAAVERHALVIDGGTQSGIMEMMGRGVADRSPEDPAHRTALLGIAPAGKVTYPGGPDAGSLQDAGPLDPNHTHFALAASDQWGGETPMLFALAEEMKETHRIPVVVILANGGTIAQSEALHAVRHGWPIIVLEGSGELADKVAQLCHAKTTLEAERTDRAQGPSGWLSIDDPDLAEIIEEGDIYIFAHDANVSELRYFVLQLLQTTKADVLELAWQRFAVYDQNAARQQKYFYLLRGWPLVLGVITTSLTLTFTFLKQKLGDPLPEWWLRAIFELPIISLPIIVSILLAADTRFKAGNKWALLRSVAEGTKREIYRYRVQASLADLVKDKQKKKQALDEYAAELQQKLEDSSRRMMRTDVNEAALRPYHGPLPPQMYGAAGQDDGFSSLKPDQYIAIRIADQLSYYEKKTNTLEKQLRQYQWLILAFGGAGTLLAATGVELWIPITVGIISALTTYIEYHGLEVSLRKYNQTATNLANIQSKWASYSVKDKTEKLEWLLNATEDTLEYELIGWVQQMRDILAEEPKKEPDGSSPNPEQPNSKPPKQQLPDDQHSKPDTLAADVSSNASPDKVSNPLPPGEEQK
jgi:hypothetical protein